MTNNNIYSLYKLGNIMNVVYLILFADAFSKYCNTYEDQGNIYWCQKGNQYGFNSIILNNGIEYVYISSVNEKIITFTPNYDSTVRLSQLKFNGGSYSKVVLQTNNPKQPFTVHNLNIDKLILDFKWINTEFTEIDSTINARVFVYNKPTFIKSMINERMYLVFKTTFNDTNNLYVNIDFTSNTFDVYPILGFLNNILMLDNYFVNKKCVYLFSGNAVTIKNVYVQDSTISAKKYDVLSICRRENYNRFILKPKKNNQLTDCSCKMLNGNVAMQTTIFNYPDCIYNSSYLYLHTTYTDTNTVIGDLNVWNTIIFMKSYQSLFVETGVILTLNQLVVIQEGCYIFGSVKIKKYMYSQTNIPIYFETTPTFGYTTNYLTNDVIFYYKTKSSSFDLITDVTKCEHAVMHSNSDCSTSQKCYLSGSSTVPTATTYNGNTNLFCGLKTLPFLFDLVFSSTFKGSYKISGESYWNQLYCLATNCNLSSTKVIDIKKIVVDNTFGDLILNTEIIIENYEITTSKTYYVTMNMDIATLKIDIQNNMNTNILFVINNGTLAIKNIEIGSSVTTCIDIVSSKTSITEYSSVTINNSNYKVMTDLLSQRLLRICPTNNENSTIVCIEKASPIATSITSYYKYPHCPCTQSNCIVQFS
ncbi:hypothetical protein EIN_247600, partial [Entamoeba invadens IP1]